MQDRSSCNRIAKQPFNPMPEHNNPSDALHAEAGDDSKDQAIHAEDVDELADEELDSDKLNNVSGARPRTRADISTDSDKRLKHNIETLPASHRGAPLYRFRYNENPEIEWVGVMAQDLLLLPELCDAVSVDDRGNYQVNYDQLGFNMLPYAEWRAQFKSH